MGTSQTVYVVDSDPTIGMALTELLGTYGLPVKVFQDTAAFLDDLPGGSADTSCLVLDKELAGGDNLPLIASLRERGFAAPVLLLVATLNDALRERAMTLGVADVIVRLHMESYLLDRLARVLSSASSTESFARIALSNGTEVRFRTMQPEDVEIQQAFVHSLSARSRYLRFFSSMNELPPALMHTLTHTDYPDSYAVIATFIDPEGERQVGVARYSPTANAGTVEFAVVVADEWQGYGIARNLLSIVIAAAAMAGMSRIEGLVLRENERMFRLAKELGFKPMRGNDDFSVVRIAKDLVVDQPVHAGPA